MASSLPVITGAPPCGPPSNGLEGQLDELLGRSWKIQSELYLRALGDCQTSSSGQVFRMVKSDGIEAMTSWVFDGIQAMRGVRLAHFLCDVDARRTCWMTEPFKRSRSMCPGRDVTAT